MTSLSPFSFHENDSCNIHLSNSFTNEIDFNYTSINSKYIFELKFTIFI